MVRVSDAKLVMLIIRIGVDNDDNDDNADNDGDDDADDADDDDDVDDTFVFLSSALARQISCR